MLRRGFVEWREVTAGKPILALSKNFRRWLPADWEYLSDSDIARSPGGIVADDHVFLAAMQKAEDGPEDDDDGGGPGGGGPFDEGHTEDAEEFDSAWTTAVHVDSRVAQECFGSPMDARISLCQWYDDYGPAGLVGQLVWLIGGGARAWHRDADGAYRVGTAEWEGEGWEPVPWREVRDGRIGCFRDDRGSLRVIDAGEARGPGGRPGGLVASAEPGHDG